MTKYNCTVIFDASASVGIEADTPEDAAEQAENETQGRQNLCHQCANDLDTGDSIGVLVYNEDCTKELLDTTYKPPRIWVGLTDDERLEAAEIDGADEWFWKVCKAIEAKLKEKNGIAPQGDTK